MRNNNYNSKSGKNQGGRGDESSSNQNGSTNRVNRSTTKGKGNRKTNDTKSSTNSGRGIGPASYVFATTPQSIIDTGNLSFSYSTGLPFDIKTGLGTIRHCVPGIMALKFVPTLGIDASQPLAASPINVCSRALYAKMWAMRSGASTAYDPADVMLYGIGLANFRMFHTFLKRAYGVASQYSVNNRYLPTALLKSMGFLKPEEIILGGMPRFRALINSMADAMSSFAIPSGIPIFSTWNEMVEAIYLDGDSEKSQMYFYKPEWVYVINDTAETGTSLGQVETDTLLANLDILESTVRSWIDVLLSSQDFSVITADLCRTFGDESVLLKFDRIEEEYTTPFLYDPAVLVAIANTTIVEEVGEVLQDLNGNIMQDVAYAKSTSGSTGFTDEVILNFPMGEVSPELVFMATRGTALQLDEFDPDRGSSLATCGAYAVTGVSVCKNPYYGDDVKVSFQNIPTFKDDYTTAEVDTIKNLFMLSNFAFHPIVQMYDSRNKSQKEMVYYGNIHNFTVLSAKELREINRVYLTAQFGLPYMA